MEGFDVKKLLKIVIPILVVILLVSFFNPITCVGASERGVRFKFGAAEDVVLQPGINYHVPIIGRISTWSIKPHTYDVNIPITDRGAISADNQIIGVEGKIVWNFDETKIVTIAKQYPNQADLEEIIKNTSYAAIKSVIGKYTIFRLAESQTAISGEAFQNLKTMLSQYPIVITQFNVTNFDWSPEFDTQINATMQAAQQVRQAEQQANITEQQSRQRVIEADANAKAMESEANGRLIAARLNAEAKIVEGEALAAYNASVAQNLSVQTRLKELEIELERAKRWNGKEVPDSAYIVPGTGAVIPLTGR